MSGFDAARRAALMKDLLAHLLNRPADLLSFEQVRDRLHLRRVIDRGIFEVKLDNIVGSLGREREFTRAFLPREESLRERWDDVKDLAEGSAGFPPIELYKVGDAYFVVDGHHRVSVAKSLRSPSIEAHVREFLTPVPLDAETSIADLILKEGLADFLEATGLAPEQPDEFRVTDADGYERLLDHVSVHRYFLGIERASEIMIGDAAESWRRAIYRPMIETIRSSRVLEDFPGRTETDLYLFTMDHLHYLRQRYGHEGVLDAAGVRHFRMTQRPATRRKRKNAQRRTKKKE